MRSLPSLAFALGVAAFLSPVVEAQSALQLELKDTAIAPHWIYDNLPKALAEAQATSKPLLVVLRCVPCPPGKTLDGQVMQPDKNLLELEKKFVCVRIIQTKGLDLKLFQYDFDQSWCAVFMNADKTIYGRYGTRATNGPKSDELLSVPSLKLALKRALELHKGYPGIKSQLVAKTGKDPEYRVPEEIPSLKDRAMGETTRRTCIHCHMVKEHIIRTKWQEKRLTPADLWVYPLPEAVGLTMNVDDGLLVKSVVKGSPADQAGIFAGDGLLMLNGQPLISQADIQWVLQNIPGEAKIAATLRRDGKVLDKSIAVSGNWRESDISWRASSWYGLRQGLKVDPLSPEDKKKRGLGADDLGLLIKGLFGTSGTALTKAGLKKDDVIVAVDGKTGAMNESQFLANLRLQHGPADAVKFTVLRGTKREELTIPMW